MCRPVQELAESVAMVNYYQNNRGIRIFSFTNIVADLISIVRKIELPAYVWFIPNHYSMLSSSLFLIRPTKIRSDTIVHIAIDKDSQSCQKKVNERKYQTVESHQASSGYSQTSRPSSLFFDETKNTNTESKCLNSIGGQKRNAVALRNTKRTYYAIQRVRKKSQGIV